MLAAASPALADNGPHIMTKGDMTVDRCAGCHRAHTSSNEYLLTSSAEALCASCHGNGATGASTNVMEGVQYAITGTDTRGGVTGALRGGGFTKARIDSTSGVNKTVVYPLGNAAVGINSTSSHSVDGTSQTTWGSGAISATSTATGTSLALECVNCHDPHGNGNFRILKPVPTAPDGVTSLAPAPVAVTSVAYTSSSVDESDGKTYYYYTVTTGAAHNLTVTLPVTLMGTTVNTVNGGVANSTNSTVSIYATPTTTSFTFRTSVLGQYSNVLTADTVIATGGFAGQGLSNYVRSAAVGTAIPVTVAPLTDLITLTGHKFVNGSMLSFAGTAVPAGLSASRTYYAVKVDANTFKVAVSPANATAATPIVVDITDAGTAVTIPVATIKTWAAHYLKTGQNLTVTKVANASGQTSSAWNSVYGTVVAAAASGQFYSYSTTTSLWTATGTTDQFDVTVPNATTLAGATGAYTDMTFGGSIGIADVFTKKYTTTNYWAADDYCADSANAAANACATVPTTTSPASQSPFIANISQWCSTCHSRYQAGSKSYAVSLKTADATPVVDGVFTYRHRSQNGKENSPNCIQCHVAHGSNAGMTGQYSSVAPWPGTNATPVPSADSRLLRVDNRGTCTMCHNK
jgi:predicted CXXCH cytochrome family protein